MAALCPEDRRRFVGRGEIGPVQDREDERLVDALVAAEVVVLTNKPG